MQPQNDANYRELSRIYLDVLVSSSSSGTASICAGSSIIRARRCGRLGLESPWHATIPYSLQSRPADAVDSSTLTVVSENLAASAFKHAFTKVPDPGEFNFRQAVQHMSAIAGIGKDRGTGQQAEMPHDKQQEFSHNHTPDFELNVQRASTNTQRDFRLIIWSLPGVGQLRPRLPC